MISDPNGLVIIPGDEVYYFNKQIVIYSGDSITVIPINRNKEV